MMIRFHTVNLNEKLYRKLINQFVNRTFARDDSNDFQLFKQFMRTWEVDIYPSSMASEDPFFYGKDGVGGITGNFRIKLYLLDEDTLFGDVFQRVFRANAIPITHEFCHAILIYLGRNEKVALRNDDFGGHKKGQMFNFSTAEVHDRHIEGKFWNMNFWFIQTLPKLMIAKALDIRDLV